MAEDTCRWYYRRGLKVMYTIGFFTALILSTIFATVFIMSNWESWKKDQYADEDMRATLTVIGVAFAAIASWVGVIFIITAILTKYIYNKRKQND